MTYNCRYQCIVTHAGDVPGSDNEKKNKTDKVDAVRLARHHAAGLLEAIHVPEILLKFQGIEIPANMDNPNRRVSGHDKSFYT